MAKRWGQLNRRDLYIYSLLIALGGLQLALSCRTLDFTYDPYYYELAKSLLAKTGYGFNGRAEPMVPPGFPAFLALLIFIVGNSYAVLIRSMAVFTTLGSILTYELLKPKEGRAVAAAICVLFASSPSLFEFSTRLLFSDIPYFFTSLAFLWAVPRLNSAITRSWARTLSWWISCTLLLVSSILLRSTGIALAGGLLGWLFISQHRKRTNTAVRHAFFLTIVILGVATEASWIFWANHHPVTEWPVHGFQESYLAQLRLKNGNNPELGMATWQDVLKRPLENEDDMATAMGALFSHKDTAPAWYSPATVIPLALLLLGLGISFFRSGGDITEWYFLAYQVIYLFWPWNYEWRFQIPVAPLAALYMWRGLRLLWYWAKMSPRLTYAVSTAMAVSGTLATALWGMHTRHPSGLLCLVLWLLAGILFMTFLRPDAVRKASFSQYRYPESAKLARTSVVRLACMIALTCMVATGVWAQVREGIDNLHRVPEMDANIEAAQWVRAHSAPDAVVMARWESMVYHYSGRRVIWFPASTDPSLLMAGIRRFHISLIVLTEGDSDGSYWTPSDRRCFGTLLRTYPEMFHQVHRGGHEQIYEYDGSIPQYDPSTTVSRGSF